MKRSIRIVCTCLTVSVAGLLLSSPAAAQAVLPEKGEASVALLFNNALATKHYLPVTSVDRGDIDSASVLAEFTYALTDRVAVSASVPYVFTRYRGGNAHRDEHGHDVGMDDGAWHGTLQDFRFAVRYNVTQRGAFITPFVGTVTPSHGYEYFAHSAPGRAIHEMVTGVSVARVFTTTGVFVQGLYGFGVAERVVGFRPLHSEAQVEVGYFVTPAFRVMGSMSGRFAHNGIDLTQTSRADLPWDQYVNHDRISREELLNAAAGVSLSVSDRIDIFASVAHTLAGRNSHGLRYAFTTGLAWTLRESNSVRAARQQGARPTP